LNILVVDDEASLRRTLRMTLEAMKHRVLETAAGGNALQYLKQETIDFIFLDLRLGHESGLDFLPQFLEINSQCGVTVMTAYAGIDSAVQAIRLGAFDYLQKPFTPNQLRIILQKWQDHIRVQGELTELRQQLKVSSEFDLQSEEPIMQNALALATRVAPTEAAILLRGESGTGKGVFARFIHTNSPRAKKSFVTIHCPSLSAELLESELFGHVRGAFTGAVESTEGKVSIAQGGTLFLDEIGDLPLTLQAKLLRFLQEKMYERVGDPHTRTGDVRIVTATNRNLESEVKAGKFREDLFYRLNVIEVTLPALRDRAKDIPNLANHLLKVFAHQTGKTVRQFTPEALSAITRHRWPGNIRELRNAIERGVILTSDDEIGLSHLPEHVGRPTLVTETLEVGASITLEQLEIEHIRRVLTRTSSLEEAAEILGIDPSTLYRKRKKLGL